MRWGLALSGTLYVPPLEILHVQNDIGSEILQP